MAIKIKHSMNREVISLKLEPSLASPSSLRHSLLPAPNAKLARRAKSTKGPSAPGSDLGLGVVNDARSRHRNTSIHKTKVQGVPTTRPHQGTYFNVKKFRVPVR